MQNTQLAKYKIGLLVIGVFTAAMLVMVLVQANATKQDAQTDKIANDVADKLNTYTEEQYTVPESLQQAGISKSSPSITYAKLSDSKYKFCVTYKTASSNFDPASVEAGLVTGSSPSDFGTDTSTSSYLTVSTSHHKGANCQTIDTGGGINYGGGTLCGNPASNAYDACILQNNESVSGSTDSVTKGGGTTSNAADSERETDLNTLDAHLEAYYANNGYYPTLTELNDATWRSTNMQGLDASAVCDPSSSATKNCALASDTKKGVYSYRATDANSQTCTQDVNCTSFELTAMLSTGSRYTKQSST